LDADYAEYLRYIGVRPRDRRLGRPEFLSGGSQIIQMSEVLDVGKTTIGDMKGHGIAAMRSNKFRRFIDEHGIIMCLMSVVPKSIYASGLPRKFSRTIKEEYFQKELQFIGEQAVLNKEVYAEHTTPDGTFGYQSRYDEYRSHPSGISGDFWSDYDHWHLARIFGGDPALNSTFTNCSPAESRIFASTSSDTMLVMANHSIQARRPMTNVVKPRTF